MNPLAKLQEERKQLTAEIQALRRTRGMKIESGVPSAAYAKRMAPHSRALDRCLLKMIDALDTRGPDHFSRENVWLWGGPTPYWGGSMDPAAAMKGARCLDLENVVYVYGEVTETTMALHRPCRKVLCQLTRINRSPGAQRQSNVENAETLSRLSLQFPNIQGGIIDDLIGNYGYTISRAEVKEIAAALKRHNAKLQLYAVVYVHELDLEATRILQPLIDGVNLWVWAKQDLPDLDLAIEKCRRVFPGKPIMLGAFMHDYGACELGMPPKLLDYQLRKARDYLAAGKIHDLVILGDREIAKWPGATRTVKRFLASQFTPS